jgi:L-cysteine/cystine lyase
VSLDAAAFRARFPVFERFSYLNAGTEGPLPARAAQAVRERLDEELHGGRCGKAFFERTLDLAGELRVRYASLLGASPEHVALTGSTTDGVNTVLAGLSLGPGDEVLTSDQEHPGLLAPLGLAHRRRGVSVRVVPFAELAGAVSQRTRLIACSHVSWVNGSVADVAAIVATGVPVLLDAAQALGAVPVDVAALGCAFYAASGQKWLCGPEGSGCLYVAAERLEELTIPWPGFGSIADHERWLELPPKEGAARFDHGFPSGVRSTWALASLEVLSEFGWDALHARAAALARRLSDGLSGAGLAVLPRGESTLVSWRVTGDPDDEVARLHAAGVVVRSIPGAGALRASVGAWCVEEELDRLVELAAG